MPKPEELKINLPETTWVFISAGQGQPRHLLDIAWAVASLRSRGVQDKNIFVFQDDPNFRSHLDDFSMSNLVHDLKDFAKNPIVTQSEVCFFVFAGHGSPMGIESDNTLLTPTDIFKWARTVKNSKRCILIMGQCFGGIFEALDASSEKPEIGVIAATELNLSLSNSFCLMRRNIKFANSKNEVIKHWAANVFLFHFFQWIRQPEDIDGDGKYTLLDAYKHAGALTNDDLSNARLLQSLDLDGELEAAKQKLRDHNSEKTKLDALALDAAYVNIERLSTGLHIYSDPWILHAHLIRATELLF